MKESPVKVREIWLERCRIRWVHVLLFGVCMMLAVHVHSAGSERIQSQSLVLIA